MGDYDDYPIADIQRRVLEARKRALESGAAGQPAFSEKVQSALAADGGRDCDGLFDLAITLYDEAIQAYDDGESRLAELLTLIGNDYHEQALLCLLRSGS